MESVEEATVSLLLRLASRPPVYRGATCGRFIDDGYLSFEDTPWPCHLSVDLWGIGGGALGGESEEVLGLKPSMLEMLGRTGKRPPVTPRLAGRGVVSWLSLGGR